MEAVELSAVDRTLIIRLTDELRRFNDKRDAETFDPLLSVQEAARYLGVTRQTVSAKIRQKVLTKVSRGGSFGILKSKLDEVKSLQTTAD